MRTVPGSADVSTRAATFTVSPRARARVQLVDRLDRGEGGPDRLFGGVVVGDGIPEQRQDAVADQAGDMTAEALDHVGGNRVVGADRITGVLGVESGRELGRADDVAEQDRELPMLRFTLRPRAQAGLLRGSIGSGDQDLAVSFGDALDLDQFAHQVSERIVVELELAAQRADRHAALYLEVLGSAADDVEEAHVTSRSAPSRRGPCVLPSAG